MTDSAEVAVLGTGRLLRAGTREKVISRFAEYEEHLDHDRSYHRGCHVGGFSLATKAGSRQLALDPLRGHPDRLKRLDEPGARATLKQLARLGENRGSSGLWASVVRNARLSARFVRASLAGVPALILCWTRSA